MLKVMLGKSAAIMFGQPVVKPTLKLMLAKLAVNVYGLGISFVQLMPTFILLPVNLAAVAFRTIVCKLI